MERCHKLISGVPRVLRELLRSAKENYAVFFSLAVISILVVCSIFPEYLAREDYRLTNLPNRFQIPSLQYPLGTDYLGRDLLSLVIWGCRYALIEMIWPNLLALAIGLSLGILSAYLGGVFDLITMRIIDILMSFPDLLLALAIIVVLGPGLTNALLAVAIGRIAGYARLSRSLALPLKDVGYVEYARALGASKFHIMTRHLLLNILSPIIVQLTFSMPGTLAAVAGLSFLGLGGSPPTADWGVLLQLSRKYLYYAPWEVFVPSFVIFLVAFSFNIVGETLRDIVDPRRKYLRIF